MHISELQQERVGKTTDVVKDGDQVKVKVLGFDDRGKVKLSMRVVDQATGEDITEKVGAKPAAVTGTGDAASGAIGGDAAASAATEVPTRPAAASAPTPRRRLEPLAGGLAAGGARNSRASGQTAVTVVSYGL